MVYIVLLILLPSGAVIDGGRIQTTSLKDCQDVINEYKRENPDMSPFFKLVCEQEI